MHKARQSITMKLALIFNVCAGLESVPEVISIVYVSPATNPVILNTTALFAATLFLLMIFADEFNASFANVRSELVISVTVGVPLNDSPSSSSPTNETDASRVSPS